MFWIRWQDVALGAYTTIALAPGPTFVEYPERRIFTSTVTPDGAVIVSRPMRDSRERAWIWQNYRDSSLLAAYKNQWTQLLTLEYRTRLEAGLHPFVEIWEDVMPEGGFDRDDGAGNNVWTVVKFLQVDRSSRKQGGRVIYDESRITFIIADSTYTGF